jgi:hypothetical protein
VQKVESFPLEHPLDPEDRVRAENDVGQAHRSPARSPSARVGSRRPAALRAALRAGGDTSSASRVDRGRSGSVPRAPSFSSACAWCSACSGTPPQNDHEYGTTIPTFIGGMMPESAGRLCGLGRLRAPVRPRRASAARRRSRVPESPCRRSAVVAGGQVPVAVVHERRLELGTDVCCVAATWVEATAGGRVDRRRHVPSSTIRSRAADSRGSGIGTAESRASVYGMIGRS